MFTEKANHQYTLWTVACFSAFMALASLAQAGPTQGLGDTGRLALSFAVAVPVAAHVWATFRLVRQSDEYAFAITAKRFALAWGISMTACCVWGVAESLDQVPHAPGWLAYPTFWAAFALSSLLVRTSR